MSKVFKKGSAFVLSVAMSAVLLAGCGGGGGAAGGGGTDVDPATLAFPLSETATISGLTS